MKILISSIFLLLALTSFNSIAGVALHCENKGDGSVLCDAIATGTTEIKVVAWSASSPAAILQDEGLSASFGCLAGRQDSGVIVLDYTTDVSYKGKATFNLDCVAIKAICTLPPPGAAETGGKPKPREAC